MDAASYFGYVITESEFLNRLPFADNPNRGFVGQIDGPSGQIPPEPYGVYARPVAIVLRQVGAPAVARAGLSFTGLQAEIAAGRPVIVWVIGRVQAGYPITYTTPSNEQVTVAYWEHTVVVVGYDEESVYIVDPTYNAHYVRRIDIFEKSWNVLGNMAIVFQERDYVED